MRSRIWLAAVLILASISVVSAQGAAPAQSKIDPAKEADLRKLVRISGAAQVGDQMTARMMGPLRELFSQTTTDNDRLQKMLGEMLRRFQKEFTGERMMAEIVPIYDHYLNHDDVKGLIAFYETPLGRKMLALTPRLLADSMTAGSKLGQEVMLQVMQEMSKDYPELRALMEPPSGAKPPQN